jgi:hypothetical protein
MNSLGERLIDLVKGARRECVLAAPYIKAATLNRIISAIPVGRQIKVVTRWRIDEIAMGVSDLEVWNLLKRRENATLWLKPTLHAKYYRADKNIAFGSANLTDAALGWGKNPNLEILEVINPSHTSLQQFENMLFSGTTVVDEKLYLSFVRALDDFPSPPSEIAPEITVAETVTAENCRPCVRFPEDLYVFYTGKGETLTAAARDAAATDLTALQPPPALSESAFKAWIGLAILQSAEFKEIDAFIVESKRFGEMRKFIAARGATDGSWSWQTWMRWILHFLPNHFVFHTANYSEIVSRR